MPQQNPQRPRIIVQTATPFVSCRDVAASIWELLDGALHARRAAAVRAHLAACTSCRDRHEAARALLGAVARVQRSDPAPDRLRERVDALLRERGHLQ
jgi:mycothiol system anti-sigma-R factor